MGLFDLFRNKQNDEELCLMRDLIAMSAADGELAPAEALLLKKIADSEGIDFEKHIKKLDNPSVIRDAYPKTTAKKLEYLLKVVSLMVADGECTTDEINFSNLIAARMGLSERAVAAAVAFIVKSMKDVETGHDIVLSYVANGGYYPEDK